MLAWRCSRWFLASCRFTAWKRSALVQCGQPLGQTHQLFDPLDKPHYGLNKLIHEKSQIWGLLITVFSLCALFLLVWYLRR